MSISPIYHFKSYIPSVVSSAVTAVHRVATNHPGYSMAMGAAVIFGLYLCHRRSSSVALPVGIPTTYEVVAECHRLIQEDRDFVGAERLADDLRVEMASKS